MSELWLHAQGDGEDIAFTGADGSNQLSHEIESYNTNTTEMAIWVRIPELSGAEDTVLYLYYGNPAASSQEDTGAVWIADYAGVWHLSETNAGTRSEEYIFLDSTTNANNGRDYVTDTGQDGQVNGGQAIASNTTDYIVCDNTDSLTSPIG